MNKPFKDMTVQKFGRLTALRRLHNTKGKTKWLCVCDCGNFTETYQMDLHRGSARSCGCYRKEKTKEIHTTHGNRNSRLYKIWIGIKKRCYNDKCYNYQDYGGRGIVLYNGWLHDFQAFYDWSMSNGYNDNLTIDRINNNGNYEPSNCRWVDRKTQAQNRRSSKMYTINGDTHCLKEWCEILIIKQYIKGLVHIIGLLKKH